jgi:hypothetical protein
MDKTKNRVLELLSSPRFFPDLLRAIREARVVGEEQNALVIYIVGTSRLLEEPLCIFVKGPSSVGKNFLADKVLEFFPSSEIFLMTSSSARSLNYQGTKLKHKIIYLKEKNESAGPVHPTRLLISEGKLVHYTTVKRRGRFVSERHETRGPVASVSTTTKDRVEVDDETRQVSIWLDETPDQTTRIMQAAVAKQNGLEASEKKAWHKVQRLIQKRAAIPIELPDWFNNLVPFVSNDHLVARRYFPAFLQACRIVALIRSFRRKRMPTTKSKRIFVRFIDFAVTALVFNAVFEHSINRADDEDIEIQQHVRRISSRKGSGVSATDLAAQIDISTDRAYSLLRKAVDAGTIFRANQPSEANLKLYLPTKPRPFLPDPAEVFQKLEGLPERVKFVHPVTGVWVTYIRKRD